MIFTETPLEGAFIIEPERLADRRGFFARSYCQREFDLRGISFMPVQCNISYNESAGLYGACIINQRPTRRRN